MKALRSGFLKKWSSLGSAVPGSIMQLYLTEVELSIISMPTSDELEQGLKVAARIGVGIVRVGLML